jgi:hypothetical protein
MLEKMKSKIASIVFLWLLYANSLAYSYKIFAGINSGKYLFSDQVTNIEHKQRTAPSGGVGISFQLKKKFVLEINTIFDSGGAKTQIPYSTELKLNGIYRNTNLAFPIILKYRFLPISTPYLGIGPEIIYLLSHNLEIPEMEQKLNILDATKKLHFGLTLIAGYEYKIKKLTVFGELRYKHWFTTLLKDTAASVKNESWAFYLGLVLKNHAD